MPLSQVSSKLIMGIFDPLFSYVAKYSECVVSSYIQEKRILFIQTTFGVLNLTFGYY